MKFWIPLACVLTIAGTTVTAHAKITRTVEKTFAVQTGGRLSAETQGGNITVKAEDTNEVRVVVTQTIDASTDAAADKLLEKLKLTLDQQANDVTVIAKFERPFTSMWDRNSVLVSYTITVPRQFHLQLNTSGGDITVASVKGTVSARTSGGNLWFERVDGDLDGKTSGGNVTLKEGSARAHVSTSGGNIQIERATGPVTASTSGGDIKIQSASQVVSASTSGGNITAKLTDPLQQDSTLHTSGGNVTVSVLRSAGFVLDAETSGGDVQTGDLALSNVQMNKSKSRVTATVNAGGPKLSLRTSGGDIRVRAD